MEQVSARDALLGALHQLAGAATLPALRRVLHQLVDDQGADTTAPPTREGGGAEADVTDQDHIQPRSTVQAAPRTVRGLRTVQPTRSGHTHANSCKTAITDRLTPAEWRALKLRVAAERQQRGLSVAELAGVLGLAPTTLRAMGKRHPPGAPTVARLRRFIAADPAPPSDAVKPAATPPPAPAPAEWSVLRELVRAEQKRRGWGLAELAGAIGREHDTVRNVMTKLSTPSLPIMALLRAFVATSAPGGGNGSAETSAALPLEPEAVAALKRKRHAAALTTPTLAERLAVTVTELDNALAGLPVPPVAAGRLTAWVAG